MHLLSLLQATDGVTSHQQLFKERIHEHAVDFSQTEDYKLWSYKLTVTWKFNKRKGRYNGMNSAEDELNRL